MQYRIVDFSPRDSPQPTARVPACGWWTDLPILARATTPSKNAPPTAVVVHLGNHSDTATGWAGPSLLPPTKNKMSYIPQRRRPGEVDVVQSRKQSVHDSILRFVGNTTSVDAFKEGLVRSAKKHHHRQCRRDDADDKDHENEEGELILTGSSSPSPLSSQPSSKLRTKAKESTTLKTLNNNGSSDHETSNSPTVSPKRKKKKKTKNRRDNGSSSNSKTTPSEHRKRAKAAQEKLNISLHSLHEEEFAELVASLGQGVCTSMGVASNYTTKTKDDKRQIARKAQAGQASFHKPDSKKIEQQDDGMVAYKKKTDSAPSALCAAHEITSPQMDLKGFMSHLAVLDDLHGLISPLGRARSTLGSDCSIDRNTGRSSRFHQMFQVKCSLFALLDGEDSPQDLSAQMEALQNRYTVDMQDLELALEHIRIAQTYNNEIRWDLIKSLFFPESPDLSIANPHRSPLRRPSLSSEKDEAASEMVSIMETQSNHCIKMGSQTVSDERPLSQREQYQEAVLDLYEAMEDSLPELSPEDAYTRQQILIHLLRATSEEESHLTSLSLDDIQEIVHHVELCLDHGIDAIQWPMIEEIVFPLGVDEENSVRGNVILPERELEIILRHINLSVEACEEIRWDLVAEVLFPGDVVRQQMLGGGSKYATKEEPTKERAKAALSLSNHDLEIVDAARDVPDFECAGYESFGEDSSHE